MPTKVKNQNSKVKSEVKSLKTEKVDKKSMVTEKAVKAKSLELNVFGKDGKITGKIEMPKEIFGTAENKALIAQAVRVYLSNQRIGGANTKTRGEVVGSTKKIYRQKGTGRARHGAITAPLFVGGGITFGPRTREFSLKMSTMMKRKALFSSLSSKMKTDKIIVVDIDGFGAKTKEVQALLKSLSLVNKKGDANKVLFVSSNFENVQRAARNINGLMLTQANLLTTYDVLVNNYIVLVKESIEKMKETFLKERNTN